MVDVQNSQGAVHHAIKPLWPEARFVGSAVTAKCGPRDNMAVYIAIRIARPADVLVLHTPVSLGGVPVRPGDLLVGDRDGVVVVERTPQTEKDGERRERIDLVIEGLDGVRQKEAEAQKRIAAGAELPGWIYELIASERTVRLD